jgi:hypothetical protein
VTTNNQPRISKREQRRQKLEREKRTKALRIWIPIGVVGIALIVLILIRVFQPDVEGIVKIEPAAPGSQHDNDFVYEASGLPPTGGIHNSSWLNCGTYSTEVPIENAVHSLEHGAIWVTYNPDLPADEIALLQDAVLGEGYTILSPYPDQSSSIALTAWDLQLTIDSASDERIEEFINQYKGTRGPEAGASCSGGVGNPTSS